MNADPPMSSTVRITVARSSARRVAIFAAHTGQTHTDPQDTSPPYAADREPSGLVITPSVGPASEPLAE